MTATTPATGRTIVHLIPHTHWDREWYEPFQTFRLRLVDLVDELLERMEADGRLRFTLDGQCATVDDYLEVRPEAEPLIRRLVAEGRLAIGPWQILMDEFLVSGETLVRNLEIGWARATELGGAMRVGYLPDMFGHVAQMPQILRRAGIDRAVVWRGVPAVVDRNTFAWESPDGSVVEAEYLVGGYGNGAHLFDVPGRLKAKLAEHVDANEPFYGRHSILAMYGTDHAVPSPRLADLVDAINADNSPVVVRLETLAEYAARTDIEPSGGAGAHWTGELRSGARANMLMNVTSARVDVKIAAGRAERLLERYAEPLTALHATSWPGRPLELAWRRLVDNSAHNSICGCSHDEVVAQVLTRYAEAEQIGRGVLSRTLGEIASQVATGSWAAINPSPAPREGFVEFDVAVPTEWESVELRSGDRQISSQECGRADPVVADLKLHGSEIPELFRRRRHGRELFGRQINSIDIQPDHPDGTPTVRVFADDIADPPELDVEELLGQVEAAVLARPDEAWRLTVRAAERRRILACVPMPALGWSAIEVVAGGGADATSPEPVANAVTTGVRRLDNGLVAIEVDDDGTFRLEGGGVQVQRVGRIVDGGDLGDSYNYGPPSPDVIVDKPTQVEIVAGPSGPLRGRLTIRRRFEWPVGIDPRERVRTEATVPTDVITTLELQAGEPFVRVEISFENRSRDHRVRFHVPLVGAADGSSAQGQYAVVDRGLDVEGGHGEVPLATFPAHGFVQTEGVSALLDHIVEYEVVEGRELALTLLRSFGWISRNANPYREDPAGPEVPVPGAQLIGERSMRFALMPHTGSWANASVVAAAERYQHGILVVRGTGSVGAERAAGAEVAAGADDAAPSGDGLAIEGDGIVLTALRRRGDWLELRVVAESANPTEAVIRGRFDEARDADLLGRPMGALATEPGVLRLSLGPWEIRTIHVRSS